MIREVLKMGDPRLLQRSAEIEAFDTPQLRALLEDMRDTMAHLSGAGLAAPQIGVPLRVVIFGVRSNPRYPDVGEVPDTVLINPVLEPIGAELEEGWEGCLSVPGLRGVVPRHRRLRYRGFDQRGEPIDRDHLDGILYPMRMKDLSRLGFVDVLFPGQDLDDD
jgi:peptide deformylase